MIQFGLDMFHNGLIFSMRQSLHVFFSLWCVSFILLVCVKTRTDFCIPQV
ncbi:hypothetical protein Hanom_Chr14g01329301 [Helianthus anomalus]